MSIFVTTYMLQDFEFYFQISSSGKVAISLIRAYIDLLHSKLLRWGNDLNSPFFFGNK